MKACYIDSFGGPEVIRIGELPEPKTIPETVKVEMRAAALNHLDLWVRKGEAGVKLNFPHVLGCDGAGVVKEVGSGVTHVEAGDEVILFPGVSCLSCEACFLGNETLCKQYQILGEHRAGTLQQYVVVPKQNVFLKPANVSFDEAAAFPLVYITAWNMLARRAELAVGSHVLIHGAGSGVSTAALQIAKLLGATVYVTGRDKEKLAQAAKLGADKVFLNTKDDWVREVKRATDAGGVDVVVDHVGAALWENSLKVLRWGGKIVTCGATSGYRAEMDLRQVFYRQLAILGSTMGTKGDFEKLLRWLSERRLEPVVHAVLPLEKVGEAHRFIEEGKLFGKMAIRI